MGQFSTILLMKYRADIDGLRAIAVFAVLLHHVWPDSISGGFVGVDIFFVISGFLISRIVLGDIQRGTFSYAEFYERRARRLLPALLTVLAAVLVAGWFLLLPTDYLATMRASLATAFFSSNVVFWRDLSLGYFAHDAKLNPLLHTWSLGVEEQFYLIYPLFLGLCVRFASRNLRQLIAISLVISFGASVLLIADKSVAVFFLAPFRAWELLVGSALAFGMVPSMRSDRLSNLGGSLGLVAILVSAYFYSPSTTFPGWAALLPVLGSAAIIHAGGGTSRLTANRLLSARPIVYVGRISYSLYLWHWPLIVLVNYAWQVEIGFREGCALVATSFALAAISNRFIEQPFRSQKDATSGQFLRWGLGASSVLACASVLGIMSAGFEQRVSAQTLVFDKERRPEIPFKRCDQLTDWCVVGNTKASPTIVFWGDSHMLAWAPAADEQMKAQGRAAYLVVHSACPPAFGISVPRVPGCLPANQRLKKFLIDRSDVEFVVLAANWTMYLKPGRIESTGAGQKDSNSQETLKSAIERTVSEIEQHGMGVSILGRVPTYSQDVPFELARRDGGFRPSFDPMPFPDSFSSVLKEVARRHEETYVDVAVAMCQPKCATARHGHSLYRDADHLSAFGALSYSWLLRDSLMRPREAASN